ncbi:PcfJ domain-containing protein [Prosthecobacter sp. SYSU 5D2]|uniref:PcfJ domain-containing protein n=1 Tax=Prosthecobacter sp. SYSU 5D2 TaxID=3134134 RepID=UPI0031FE83D0
MNPHHGQASACPQGPVLPAILHGRAWKARTLRNNCLRQHAHALVRSFRRQDLLPLKQTCARLVMVLESRSRVFHEIHPSELALVPALTRLSAYEERWLRQPEDWQPDLNADAPSQWAHFLRYLLARYPVPRFMDSAWLAKGPLLHFERDCWCALGFGQSLRQVPGFPSSVPNRLLHKMLTCAQSRSLPLAVWETQMDLLQVTPALRQAVLSSRAPQELGLHGLWTRLLEKFSSGPEASADHWATVSMVLMAKREERPAQMEALLKLPLEALIRHCFKRAARMLQMNGHLLTEEQVRRAAARSELSRLAASRWPPFLGSRPVSKNAMTASLSPWLMEELCSSNALRAEGKVMNHCVAGYAHRCKQGHSAIFSLRRHETDAEGQRVVKSYVTLEVRACTREIVQIRAFHNRPVNNTMMNMVREWATANQLL